MAASCCCYAQPQHRSVTALAALRLLIYQQLLQAGLNILEGNALAKEAFLVALHVQQHVLQGWLTELRKVVEKERHVRELVRRYDHM